MDDQRRNNYRKDKYSHIQDKLKYNNKNRFEVLREKKRAEWIKKGKQKELSVKEWIKDWVNQSFGK